MILLLDDQGKISKQSSVDASTMVVCLSKTTSDKLRELLKNERTINLDTDTSRLRKEKGGKECIFHLPYIYHIALLIFSMTTTCLFSLSNTKSGNQCMKNPSPDLPKTRLVSTESKKVATIGELGLSARQATGGATLPRNVKCLSHGREGVSRVDKRHKR